MSRYDDIIDRPRPPLRRPPMPLEDRAAQFAPFAALAGHGAAVAEAARTTQERRGLSEGECARLDRCLAHLRAIVEEGGQPTVQLVRFVADERKEGGRHVCKTGALRAVDDICGELVFIDGDRVPLADVVALEAKGLGS